MTDGPARWWQRRPLAGDALFAAALVLLEVAFLLLTPPEFWPGRMPGALAWSLLAAAPVALRRVAPWTAVGLAVATLMLPVLLKLAPGTQGLAFMVLTYTMAARRPARQAALAAVLLWMPVGVANLVAPPEGVLAVSPGYLLLNNLLIALLSYAVGRAVQARRTSVRALRERARVAEENQRSLAEQAVADERRRIARELHDVVAHHVSVMGVLATGARRVLRRDPDAADEAIATIEDTSRVTLREMRRLLDVLRTDAEPAADLTPQPGLAGIETLVEQVREAGLPVTLHVEGTPGPVEEGVSLTVYRIVQEALTNALKHAGEATAQVRITVADGYLTVEVTDTGRGPGPGPDRIGHGLVGMRERVGLYGGTLRTGPRPGGGFRVSARIPVESVGAAA
ncbi:signal transduction histidine kinase [Micromonospora palomenae]|uniref:histidine kinase n=1 Tax=Micromonospora palomenae TaxID=1461247 RepID=A0A561WWR5_9ACTN|nr:sensor histidine kinase [Micromonospora palomenae]TWG28312.1 signal transduction histidine kinase [Micromonospora palomenae]